MSREGAQIQHPTYTLLQETWSTALDVYEGLGGFLDPNRPYLVPHPREWLDHSVVQAPASASPATVVPNPSPSLPSPKLKMRRRLARYENLAESILTQIMGALWLHAPARTFTGAENAAITEWYTNVDGTETDLTAFMQAAWTTAAVFGHAFILVDKPDVEAPTAADMQAPVLRRYTPLDVIDWLVDDRGQLRAVKVLEAAPRADFSTVYRANDVLVRVVTDTDWKLFDKKGKVIDEGEHGFGRLPVVVLYGKRRALAPVIGKPVMGDPQLYIDLYNLTSEVRELLRNQTFGILNVPLGKDQSLAAEQQLIGSQVGTGGVMFSTQPAQYISPDGANATLYHEHLDRLARMIFRLTSQPWEGDSKQTESADSKRVKRTESSNVLSKYANELRLAETAIHELVYRALYGEQWEAQWDKDQPSVTYNTEFEPPDVEKMAADAAEALALDLGETATKELKKRLASSVLPGLDPKQQQQIAAEIDAMKVLTAEEKRQEMLEAAAGSMRGAVETDEADAA